jgi:hypothetical protein
VPNSWNIVETKLTNNAIVLNKYLGGSAQNMNKYRNYDASGCHTITKQNWDNFSLVFLFRGYTS